MADHGLALCGNAIMVNPDYARANPKIVVGFVRATIQGVLDTIGNPEAVTKSGRDFQPSLPSMLFAPAVAVSERRIPGAATLEAVGAGAGLTRSGGVFDRAPWRPASRT